MRLVKATIENFRCYREPFTVEFDEFTAILGQNDQGKSAIFDALNAFFEEKTADAGDFSVGGPSEFSVTCEFTDLPDQIIIDTDHLTTLSDEYLLNNSGNLAIKKVFSGAKANLSKVYAIASHPTAANANDLLKLKIRDLQRRATDLEVNLEGVNRSIKSALRKAIWTGISNLALAESEIELKDEDTKMIWTDLQRQMPIFALFRSDRPSTDQDAEAQDPMKLAVKEAIAERVRELEDIGLSVERKVKEIADLTVTKLGEMNPNLARGLSPRIRRDPWDRLFKIDLTDDGQVPVNKRGSGVRRLILLNFFRAKIEKQSEQEGRGVILAIEEPETAQHPNNQVLILEAIRDLTALGYQVVITTHTPAIARRIPMESIRFLDCDDAGCRFVHTNDEELAKKASAALGILHDHSVKLFIGVEGPRDESFWIKISRALIDGGATIPDLDELTKAGTVLFIPLGGSTIQCWTNRLAALSVPEIHICDRDAPQNGIPHYKDTTDAMNRRENCKAFTTLYLEIENYLHADAISSVYSDIAIPRFDGFDKVPDEIARLVHEAGSETQWQDLTTEKQGKKISRVKHRMNSEVVSKMTPELLAESDPDGFIMSVFDCIDHVLNGNLGILNQ